MTLESQQYDGVDAKKVPKPARRGRQAAQQRALINALRMCIMWFQPKPICKAKRLAPYWLSRARAG